MYLRNKKNIKNDMIDNNWLEITKENVYEYLSKIDYSNPNFDINVMKENLANIIGVKPAVKIDWITAVSINELKRDAGMDKDDYETKKEVPMNIEIVFIDENNTPIKLDYIP